MFENSTKNIDKEDLHQIVSISSNRTKGELSNSIDSIVDCYNTAIITNPQLKNLTIVVNCDSEQSVIFFNNSKEKYLKNTNISFVLSNPEIKNTGATNSRYKAIQKAIEEMKEISNNKTKKTNFIFSSIDDDDTRSASSLSEVLDVLNISDNEKPIQLSTSFDLKFEELPKKEDESLEDYNNRKENFIKNKTDFYGFAKDVYNNFFWTRYTLIKPEQIEEFEKMHTNIINKGTKVGDLLELASKNFVNLKSLIENFVSLTAEEKERFDNILNKDSGLADWAYLFKFPEIDYIHKEIYTQNFHISNQQGTVASLSDKKLAMLQRVITLSFLKALADETGDLKEYNNNLVIGKFLELKYAVLPAIGVNPEELKKFEEICKVIGAIPKEISFKTEKEAKEWYKNLINKFNTKENIISDSDSHSDSDEDFIVLDKRDMQAFNPQISKKVEDSPELSETDSNIKKEKEEILSGKNLKDLEEKRNKKDEDLPQIRG